jgi:hypothetical protein
MTMKTRLLLLFSLAAASGALAQGTVLFANFPLSLVTNALTGQRVPAGTTFLAALYCAADGVTDESQFVQIGPSTGFVAPGWFNDGTRTSTPAIPPGGWGMFQVRVFEAAYGASYEELQYRTEGLRGKSMIVRIKTGDPLAVPPGIPANLGGTNGLKPFMVVPWDAEDGVVRVSDGTVVEGNNGFSFVHFTISFFGRGPASVDFATEDGSATGADYVGTNGTLVFTPPSDSRVVAVPVRGDTEIEPNETFLLRLGNPNHCYLFESSGVGTIQNDDCQTSIAFGWFPGVTIVGCTGKVYRVEVADQVFGPYTAVTNLWLPQSPYLWIDTISTLGRERFYRTFLVP